MTGADLAQLSRTVVHLRPGQVARRAQLRAQQAALHRFPEAGHRILSGRILSGPGPASAAGWPGTFRPVDARTPGRWPGLAELRAGKVTLLGLARELGDGWEHADAPRLWRFQLHYWDWAWGLAADPDRLAARAAFARLWRSWHASAGFGHADAWHPYPAALRAWSWCGLHRDLAAGSDFEPDFVAGLAVHAGFLRRNLEYDVGGNHLIKGLKALAGLGVFFADERLLRLATRRLTAQLARQVLADGGHYERAPAYHCQVLADLVDVADLLRAAGLAPADELTAAVDRMRRWLGAVLTPDGRVPLLNDGYPVEGELIAILRPGAAPDGPLVVLPDTGLVRAAVGGWHVLADVGPPCPPSLPAHAHADTFGCLLHVDGVPLLIDTGTSTYEPGPVRRYERSTAAHSTVQLDGADSTEVWGVFRAGRRARVSGLSARVEGAGLTFDAVHDGFRRLPGRPHHRRRWSLIEDSLRVDDLISGRGWHEIVIRWQLAADSAVRIDGGAVLVTGPAGVFRVAVQATDPVALTVETRPVAAGFGSTADAPVLTCRIQASLPAWASTIWVRTKPPRRSCETGRPCGPSIMRAERMVAASRRDRAEPDGRAGEVLRLFEAKAVNWSAKYAPDGPLVSRLASLSAAVNSYAQAGDRVLDLGCGTGELTRTLAAAGLWVAGCDISRQMLLRAPRDRGGYAGWVQLEPGWRRLPFASAAFDVVVAASVLEYVSEPAVILRECARVLRPGGVVLYTVPDLRHPVRWAEWCAQRLVGVTGRVSGDSCRSRWSGYHAYLRASRQRHRVRWWLTASRLVGLRPAPFPADEARSALRLLAFRSADELLADEPGARQ